MSYRTVIFEQNFRCNDTVFESAVAMESFSIERIEVIVHNVLKRDVFEILEELIRKHQQRNTTSDNMV